MTVIAEERHYRRGLILGLTISELMLLLLFLLLLLLSYIFKEDHRAIENVEAANSKLQEQVTDVQQELETLKAKNKSLQEQTQLALSEANRYKKKREKIADDFRDLQLKYDKAKQIIDKTPTLKEVAELEERAARAEDLAKINEALRDEVTTAEERAAQALVEGMYESRKDLIDGVLNEVKSGGMENASPDYNDGVIRLPQDVLFDSGEGGLSSSGEQAVDLLADALTKWIPCYTADRVWACKESNVPDGAAKLSAVFIEGHTDNKPVVSLDTVEKYGDNWGLSSARAISAFNRLVQRNRNLQEYKNQEGQRLLSISGYADNRPAADNWTSEGREKNRRIDVRFIFTPNVDGVRKEFSTGVSGVVPALAPGNVPEK